LLKYSDISKEAIFPPKNLATFLMLVNAESNISIPNFLFAAKNVAGPVPMLLPNAKISFGLNFATFIR
jgi:hypothetical protein